MAEVTLEGLAKQLQEQADIISKQNETIAAMQAAALKNAAPEAAKVVSIPKEPVEFGKKKYRFNVAKFAFPGSDKQYIAEEVATDKTVLAQIIAIEGQGILTEQA